MIGKDKDPTTGIVALTAARLSLPPGTVVKHYKHGDLYRILNLSRKESNPEEIEVCYFPLIPFCSPLMPWSFEDLMSVSPWHRSLAEFTGVVFAQEEEMRRYQPLPYQPETGWGFQVGKRTSFLVSLDDAFNDLQQYLLNEENKSPFEDQVLEVLSDQRLAFNSYSRALRLGVAWLSYGVYIARHDLLNELGSEA